LNACFGLDANIVFQAYICEYTPHAPNHEAKRCCEQAGSGKTLVGGGIVSPAHDDGSV
jgi:hypothetical protein